MKKILNGIINENPLFVLSLGLCSTLAVSTTFEKAYMLGISVLLVLVCSNTIVALLKKWIGNAVRTPSLILIIGSFVTVLEILLSKYMKELYDSFGIYLSLIVVNCIILGRAISVASKESVKDSFLDGLGIGLGYLFSISLVGLIREILGNGTITIMDATKNITGYIEIIKLPTNAYFPMPLFIEPAGAFLTVGLLLGIIKTIKGGKKHETD
jgi:electron transport complex protein RnfE